jgi:hypothetical protein
MPYRPTTGNLYHDGSLKPLITGGYYRSPAFRPVLPGGFTNAGPSGPPAPVAPVLTAPAEVINGVPPYTLTWTAATGFTFDFYRIYKGDGEFGTYVLEDTVDSATLDYSPTGSSAWWYVVPYNSGTDTEGPESNREYTEVIVDSNFYYLRPDGLSYYRRPDGTSLYIRP